MECQTSDSKKLFKVFDASKRKRSRKKRGGPDDNSALTDDSTSGGCRMTATGQVASAKASLQEVRPIKSNHGGADVGRKRDRDSSPEPEVPEHRTRSPRRTRRATREGLSLALKAGLLPDSRLSSPRDAQNNPSAVVTPREDDSFIYAFLEEAIKRKKKRHSRKRESRYDDEEDPRRQARQPDESPSCERRHHKSTTPDQAVLFEAFTKICAQMNQNLQSKEKQNVPRTSSNKSLQCKVESRQRRHEPETVGRKVRSREHSCEQIHSPNARSQENMRSRVRSQDNVTITRENRGQEQCVCCHNERYSSKIDVHHKTREKSDRYQDYVPVDSRTRSRFDTRMIREEHCRDGTPHEYYRDYDERRESRHFEDSKRYYDQKTSRSYEVNRDGYADEDRACRRTARSDNNKERKYDDVRRLDDKQRYMSRDKLYDDRLEHRPRCAPSKMKCRPKKIYEYDRNSIISKDEDYRDRYSERERDSGLSVADGETSTVSGRSNYLKVVKQEIAEQREAMEKMMKLWKELMKCFKSVSHQQDPSNQDKTINCQERAENARETATAQLKLWRECMRRYETVARDVGDTDARLMEEINKQRSEMTEMASMWQECLQRYRDISNDFNSLKQKLSSPQSPVRAASTAQCEGEPPAAPYRAPPGYPMGPPSYPSGGSPLRPRASAPPWGWWGEGPRRRQSSPDSRGSRDRRHRHRERDRDEGRYKEKSSKSGATRSEQKHRKR